MLLRNLCCLLVIALSASVARGDERPAEITDITWKLGANLPEYRKGGSATTLDGKIISVFGMRQPWGEMATMYVYDPKTDVWQRGPDGPLGQTYVQGTLLGDGFFSIGGRSSRDLGGAHRVCYRLRHDSGKYVWNEIARLNERRAWAPSTSVGKKLYVFGGAHSGRGPTLGSVEMLDTAKSKPKWETIGKIPGDTRGWCGAATVRGQVYLIGGLHFFTPKPEKGSNRKRLNQLWRLDPATGRWHAQSPLPYRLAGFDCCVYRDRYIIVVGGCPETEDFTPKMHALHQKDRYHKSYYCPFVLVYDTSTDRWHRLPSLLPMPTNDIRVVIVGENLYALGGENIEPATSNTTPWLRIGRIHTLPQ